MKLRACLFVILFLSLFEPANAQNGGGKSIVLPDHKEISLHGVIDLFGPTGPSGGNAPTVLLVSGGAGGSGGNFNGGSGAPMKFNAGPGGGTEGDYNSGGPGGDILIAAGNGGDAPIQAGSGGSISINAGNGGYAEAGGNGGSITLLPGTGIGAGGPGLSGNVILAVETDQNCCQPGGVSIGKAVPNATLDVIAGGTTLADAWSVRSSRRFKTNIEPLQGALEKVELLQGVSYNRKLDGKHEIGVVAEDVERIIPELVSHDPRTNEVEGVDYARLTVLLIEAVKAQQAEIHDLKARLNQLITEPAGKLALSPRRGHAEP
jgi:hypothetical protein